MARRAGAASAGGCPLRRLDLWRHSRTFWEKDPGLSAVLGLLILFVFVLPPLASRAGGRGPVIDVAFSLLLFAGVAGLKVRQPVRMLLLALAVVATVVRLWPSSGEAAVSLASLASIGLLTAVVLAQAFRAGPVTVHRVQGAVAAFLLLGVAWAFAYDVVDALIPAAFASASALPEKRGWMYFSFVTLTTLGYGDITPVHPVARSLAMMEALTGQLYPAILIARLVSLQTLPTEKPS